MSEEVKSKNKEISQQLISMSKADLKLTLKGPQDPAANNVNVYRQNRVQLEQIIEKIGWPTISKVGEEASGSAWLIAQHVDFDVPFQEKCLKLMQAEPKDVDLAALANLTDRVAVNKGEDQTYGTQFYMNEEGSIVPRPIKDRNSLNARRTKMGLDDFEVYIERMRKDHDKIVKTKFLQPGKQTEITQSIAKIAGNIDGEDFAFVDNANKWIAENIRSERGPEIKSKVFRKRTADQIIQDGYSTGCTDKAIVFISLARAKRIPTKYVEAVKIDSDGSEGHVFAEVLLYGKWAMVDPERGNYKKDVNYQGYDIIAKGTDSWGIGTGSLEELKVKTAEYRSKKNENK